MKLQDFLIGVATGIAAAYVIKEVSNKVAPYKSANDVLNDIKAAFKEEGPIDGSWIYMKSENFNTGLMDVPVYRGGVSRINGDSFETFEFAADARTGAIMELNRVS